MIREQNKEREMENEMVDTSVRIDETLEDIIFFMLMVITLGVSCFILAKRRCEHSYIHRCFSRIDFYEHMTTEERKRRRVIETWK